MKKFEFTADMPEMEFLQGLTQHLDRKTNRTRMTDEMASDFALRVVEQRLTQKMQEERLGPTVRLDLTP